MNEKIEQVAQAIELALAEAPHFGLDPPKAAARAAIEAMREPTDEMVVAGHGPHDVGTDPNNITQRGIVASYRAMIDAALQTERAADR